MALNTLQTNYVNGNIIDASHPNEITLALTGEFVGRNSSGVPTPGQSLGTLAIPWGNLYATGIILNGLALDTSAITSLPNRIVSGRTRPLSSQAEFIRGDSAALQFTILGDTTDLVLAVNNTATTINTDLLVGGVVAGPNSNNTCDVNDSRISSDLFVGELTADIKRILIDNVGTEISSRVGQIAAFLTPAGEVFQALIKDANTLTNVYRGYYFDDAGLPNKRKVLSDNDTLTILNVGWVFVEDNGTTIDVSYRTPSISFNSPNSPQTGDYWFDISNQVWKRYSGVTFDIINRHLVGQIVADDTGVIATRSNDFSNPYLEQNNISLAIDASEIVRNISEKTKTSVYGTEVQIDLSKLTWNITTDLETGLTESADTLYYLYLSDEGREIISDQRPHLRDDLKGYYHPYESYRCVGTVNNDSSSDFDEVVNGDDFFEGRYLRFIQKATEGLDATTTAPTPATNLIEDRMWFTAQDNGLNYYRMQYRSDTTTVGAANGSGDYLWKLPKGHKFDPDKVIFFQGSIGATNGNDVYWRTHGNLGGSIDNVDNLIAGGCIPWDEDTFRIYFKGAAGANRFFNFQNWEATRTVTGWNLEMTIPTIIGE